MEVKASSSDGPAGGRRAIIQSCLSGAWGGLEMVAFETAVRLRGRGVTVLTACRPGSPLFERLNAEGLPTLEVQPRGKYLSWSAVRVFRRSLKSGDYNTVLVQQLRDLWYVVPALRGLKSIKLVGIAHTFVGIHKRDWLHRLLYRRLTRLVALTSIHKKNLLDHLPLTSDQVVILPNSVDTERFRPERGDEAFRRRFAPRAETLLIGVVTRIDRAKGLMTVVDAAARLRDARVDFKVILIGEETRGEEGFGRTLTHEIGARGLTGLVELIGHRADVETAIASLDVLLMPSPAETFGRVLIEAMASGVAIVAVSGGGVADVIDDGVNGFLVRPEDGGAMAAALQRCAADPEARARMARAGLEKSRLVYDHRRVDAEFYGLLEV